MRNLSMAERLPPVYDTRRDTLLASLLAHLALPLDALDVERPRVQRAHWISTALDRVDVARLGALLDRRMEDWEDTDLFRDRIVLIARARLAGGVDVATILDFVEGMLDAGAARLGLHVAAGRRRPPAAGTRGRVDLVENPPVVGRHTAGRLTPLDTVTLVNAGLDPAPLEATFVGLPGARAATPVLVDPAAGVLLGWAGTIPPGARLRLRATSGTLRADLDGEDRTDRLFSAEGVEAGRPLHRDQIVVPARPLMVPPGPLTLRYVTAGLYDRPAFDAVMFALAREPLRQGRFDQDEFGAALMFSPPPLWAEFSWTSPAPATVEVRIPAGLLLADQPLWPQRAQARDRLGLLIHLGVDELRAAGVRSAVALVPLRESMALGDRVRARTQLTLRDGAPLAREQAPDFGALLDTTPMDDSRLE
jgi:hypothetical protein